MRASDEDRDYDPMNLQRTAQQIFRAVPLYMEAIPIITFGHDYHLPNIQGCALPERKSFMVSAHATIDFFRLRCRPRRGPLYWS